MFSNILKDIRNKIMSIPRNVLPFSEYFDNNRPVNYQQMARRMDRKVIKLEVYFGPDRTPIIVKRDQDLIVSDLQQEIMRTYRIPIEEQVIFHKGTNIGDFPTQTLESLGIENNHPIRLTRDTDAPQRSARNIQPYFGGNQGDFNSQGALDPVSYLKEISPQRVPDPTPYQIDMYNKNAARMSQQPNDVLKLYAALGSEREYILVHGIKPVTIGDLRRELHRVWRIPPEQQCIVFKGYNLHEYLDSAPLETFGLENNSPISVWPKGTSSQQTDVRLPRGGSPPPTKIDTVFSPRIPGPPGAINSNRPLYPSETSEVLKLEIQHGSDRIPLILKGQNKYLTVLDLQNELERVTAVPLEDQRIYFRSQELHLFTHKTLKELGLENNNVVKLVGEPSKVRYSNYFGRLNPNMPNSVDQQFWGNPEFQRQNYQPQFHQNQQQQPQQQFQQQSFSPPQNQQYSQSQAFASLMPSNNRANQSQVFGQAPPPNRF